MVHDVVEPATAESAHPKEGHFAQADEVHQAASSRIDSSEAVRHVNDDEAYPEPTAEERTTLRKVADTIPVTAWGLCFVELAERASYYGVKTVFNNYIQFPLPKGGNGAGAIDPSKPNSHAGGLGLGLQTASALTLLFTFLAYIVPILGAWWADTKVGRYRAIVWGVIIGGVAHVILRYVPSPMIRSSITIKRLTSIQYANTLFTCHIHLAISEMMLTRTLSQSEALHRLS